MSRPTDRDLRIDLLKGLALAMVFVDHVEALLGVSVLSAWTLQTLGPSDAAELFVLLSGIVVGRSYSRRMQRSSFAATQLYAVRRVVTIYLAFVAVGTVAILILKAAPAGVFDRPSMQPLIESEWPGIIYRLATLQLIPFGFHFLPLYIVLLLFAPSVIWILRRSLAAAVLPSAVLYIAVQVLNGEQSGTWFAIQQKWMLNPLAWQFLFVLGLTAGSVWSRDVDRPLLMAFNRSPRWTLIAICGAVMIAGWLLRHQEYVSESWQYRPSGQLVVERLVDKPSLGVARLVHGVAVVCLLLVVLPPQAKCLGHRVARPLICCGQNSLLVYTLSVLLAYAIVILLHRLGSDSLLVAFLELDALVVLCIAASVFEKWSAESSVRDVAGRLN